MSDDEIGTLYEALQEAVTLLDSVAQEADLDGDTETFERYDDMQRVMFRFARDLAASRATIAWKDKQ